MNNLIDDIELAERFLLGRMDDIEKKELANRLDSDAQFSQLVQDTSILIEGIKYTGSQTTIEEKLNKLKSFTTMEENFLPEQETRVIRLFQLKMTRAQLWMAVAACLTIGALAIFTFINQDKFFGKPDLYAQYFEPFDSPGSGVTRGTDATNLTKKAQAYEAYDAGNYKVAADLFEQALVDEDEALFFWTLVFCLMLLDLFP